MYLRLLRSEGSATRHAYWGFHTFDGVGGVVVGFGAPIVAAAIWGAFAAPKARWPVPVAFRAAVELVLFGAAVVALVAADQVVWAVVLGVAAVSTSLLNAATESHT
jgi:uncharacterized membrane protein YhaH (DUF805 family)